MVFICIGRGKGSESLDVESEVLYLFCKVWPSAHTFCGRLTSSGAWILDLKIA